MSKRLPVIEMLPTAGDCCTPLTAAPMSADQADQLAQRLKVLADPTRLRLLSIMLADPALEGCTCDLTEALQLSQPTVTHHLRRLATVGLVTPDRKVGNFTYYRVVTDALTEIAGLLTPAPRS